MSVVSYLPYSGFSTVGHQQIQSKGLEAAQLAKSPEDPA